MTDHDDNERDNAPATQPQPPQSGDPAVQSGEDDACCAPAPRKDSD